MNALETERLAELIDRKHVCLTELHEVGRRQLELARDGKMTALLDLLIIKQQLIDLLRDIERELNPFRSQDANSRQWKTEAHRQRCAGRIEECEALLSEIIRQEKAGEMELIKRRDETAVMLEGANRAGKARWEYAAGERQQSGQLDLASET